MFRLIRLAMTFGLPGMAGTGFVKPGALLGLRVSGSPPRSTEGESGSSAGGPRKGITSVMSGTPRTGRIGNGSRPRIVGKHVTSIPSSYFGTNSGSRADMRVRFPARFGRCNCPLIGRSESPFRLPRSRLDRVLWLITGRLAGGLGQGGHYARGIRALGWLRWQDADVGPGRSSNLGESSRTPG